MSIRMIIHGSQPLSKQNCSLLGRLEGNEGNMSTLRTIMSDRGRGRGRGPGRGRGYRFDIFSCLSVQLRLKSITGFTAAFG